MKIKKALWACLGCLGVALGAIGVVVPVLPTVPFLLLAAFSFARSSEKLQSWFVGTRLYKNNLESYVAGQGMPCAAKLRVMATVTALMTVGFVLMLRKALYIPCAILACVWVLHILYFCLGVKTCASEEK